MDRDMFWGSQSFDANCERASIESDRAKGNKIVTCWADEWGRGTGESSSSSSYCHDLK
jgi:hypothetical protein